MIEVDIKINKIHVIVIGIAEIRYLCNLKALYLSDSSNDLAFCPLLSLFCTREDLCWRFSPSDILIELPLEISINDWEFMLD